MEQTWRWYGPSDPVSLTDVRRAGTTDVATVLHHVPSGEVWSIGEILKHEAIIEDAGLVWSVVESVPIHEDIKTHTGNYEQWIANYQQILRNLAQYGTRTMCYNFMPMLDWTRINLEYVLLDGSRALRFGQVESVTFEIHILKRPDAEADYTEEKIAQTAGHFATVNDEDKAHLTRNIIAGPPDVEEGHTLDQFRKHLEPYKDIDRARLCENSVIFLKVVIPVIEEIGVRMVVYPDDPPRPILGPPRVVSTIENMQWVAGTVNNMASGFTMCISSYGVYADNGLVDMIKQFNPCAYFTHLRSTAREDNSKTFHETAHLNGDVDIYGMVKVIVEEGYRRKTEGKEDLILMCSNHGHQALDNLKRKANSDYSAIDRLKGLAEARGIELTIQRTLFSRQYPSAWLHTVLVPSSLPSLFKDGSWSLR